MKAYKFRVLLDSTQEEEVFRDIVIEASDSFESLYKQIMKSFGFSGDEMASFFISDDEWEKGFEISLMDMGGGEDMPGVMDKAVVEEFIKAPDQKIILVYDFFKMWCFLIELQETLEIEVEDLPKEALSIGTAPDESEENNEGKELKGESMPGYEDLDEEDFNSGFESLDDLDNLSDDNIYN